jgi:Ca-activated chloride channel family protein
MSRSKSVLTLTLSLLTLLVQACGASNLAYEYYSPAATAAPVYDLGPTYGGKDPVNDEPYFDVFFDNYGVNPFIDTEDDPLSTFALDVDTGSYTIARRYLADGFLPDKDSVRVEEFVNFFDMAYVPPSDAAFAIHLDGGPTPFVQNERYRVLRVGIQGYQIPAEQRKDAVLTFVIDVSGSMDLENRLGAVKHSLTRLVESLRPTDQVGIVIYGSRGKALLDPTPVEQKELILNAINRLEPGGSTNAEEGLIIAYRQADQAFIPGAINRVILCSDGVANVGNTGPDSILKSIRKYADQGIQLTTVGFGMGNYNDVLMEQLADDGDGFYAYVDTLKEAERLFVHDLTGTLQTIALDAKLQVEFNSATVTRYRLIGFENRALKDEEFEDETVDAGEIGAGHSVTALYEIKLAEGAQGELATVRMRWQDPDSLEHLEQAASINVQNLAPAFESTSPQFRLATTVAAFAEVLRESYWAQGISLESLVETLDSPAWPTFQNAEVIELENLIHGAADLSPSSSQ